MLELPPKADTVLKAVLYRGQIERGEVETILGTSDRTARRVTSALLKAGALSSASIESCAAEAGVSCQVCRAMDARGVS